MKIEKEKIIEKLGVGIYHEYRAGFPGIIVEHAFITNTESPVSW